jgi:hypothetical protein
MTARPLIVIVVAMALPLNACEQERSRFSPPVPGVPDFPPTVLGIWNGTMSDESGTADATLAVDEDGSGSLSFHYKKGAPNTGYQGPITIVLGSRESNLLFTFQSEDPDRCLQGQFRGAIVSTDACSRQLSGAYQMLATAHDCPSVPGSGSFSLVNSACS